jgi:hypothetical protein
MDSSVSAFAVLAANSIVATSSFRGVPFAKPAPNPLPRLRIPPPSWGLLAPRPKPPLTSNVRARVFPALSLP